MLINTNKLRQCCLIAVHNRPGISYRKSGVIECNHSLLFTIISSTQKYHTFIPFITKSSIIKHISSHENFTELMISYGAFQELSYVSHVKMTTPDYKQCSSIQSICEKEPLKWLRSLWLIRGQGEDQSWVQYSLDFQFQSIVYEVAGGLVKDYLGQQFWKVFEKQALIQKAKKQQISIPTNNQIKNQLNIQINNPSKTILNVEPIFHSQPEKGSDNSNIYSLDVCSLEKIAPNLRDLLINNPQIKALYLTNSQVRLKIQRLHQRLENVSEYENKMKYQIRNMMTHL